MAKESHIAAIPLNATQMGQALGVSAQEIVRLYKAGKIPAEMAEGRLYRFDEEKVKAALVKRAAEKQPA